MQLILIIAPTLLAGLTFIFVLKKNLLKGANIPIDQGVTFREKPIFGSNKTWRGFLVMPFATCFWGIWLLLLVQGSLSLQHISMYFLAGICYSLFELPNSFFKRQCGIMPGESVVKTPFRVVFSLIDRIDSLIGVALIFLLFSFGTKMEITIAVLLGAFLHYCTDILMRKLHLKK